MNQKFNQSNRFFGHTLDVLRERRINGYAQALSFALDENEHSQAELFCRLMVREIGRRSQAVVRQMEIERGLA